MSTKTYLVKVNTLDNGHINKKKYMAKQLAREEPPDSGHVINVLINAPLCSGHYTHYESTPEYMATDMARSRHSRQWAWHNQGSNLIPTTSPEASRNSWVHSSAGTSPSGDFPFKTSFSIDKIK